MAQHYFSDSPTSDGRTHEVEVELAGARRSLVTAGGVFSPEHLDRGTRVLLQTLDRFEPPEPPGPILDLGCGWGPIALSAALTSPSEDVWAIDVNERARTLTRTNADRLGLTNVRVAGPDDVPDDVRFAQIHSNPPIRVGKPALHEMLTQWLPRLTPGGTAMLVVAKHLGAESLQRWIAETHDTLTVDRAARDRGFHVIRAVNR